MKEKVRGQTHAKEIKLLLWKTYKHSGEMKITSKEKFKCKLCDFDEKNINEK